MLQDRNKIRRILDELVLNALRGGASKISAEIEDLPQEIRIAVWDNGRTPDPTEREKLLASLNSGRRDELDTYYGELCGESHTSNCLAMVGMMIDRAEFASDPEGGNRLVVHRMKHRGKQ
jgi:anti-sigma regulatory factor (Ser/Thr protein kinase)